MFRYKRREELSQRPEEKQLLTGREKKEPVLGMNTLIEKRSPTEGKETL